MFDANVTKLIRSHELFPSHLSSVSNSPEYLYCKYDEKIDPLIFENCLSVVGSRRMTSYGENITKKLVAKLVSYGVTIVSGFMYGIDAVSHAAALDNGGKTIAVMPCGINAICPSYQKELYYRILSTGGLILSEYSGISQPRSWTFVKRNRIVAALSSAVLVVEADLNSGSLITADFAFKYNRKVFVVPSSLNSKNSLGIVGLIKKGATPISDADDILNFYGFQSRDLSLNNSVHAEIKKSLDPLSLEVISHLEYEPLSIDELAIKISTDISKLNSNVTNLLISGILYENQNKYHIS